MATQAYLWHYMVAGILLALLGVAAHVCRAVFNVFPDRLSDNPRMDMLVSDGYNLGDHVFGTEYDDAGYYKFDSWINCRNSMVAFLITGWAAMLFVPGVSGIVAYGINSVAEWLWALFLYRLNEAGIM